MKESPVPVNFPSLLLIAILLLAACQESPKPAIEAGASSHPTFSEPHRPQFHFTPAKAWMNDPNGLYYLDGVYHMSYQ